MAKPAERSDDAPPDASSRWFPSSNGRRLEPGFLRLARIRLLSMHHRAGVGHLGGNLSAFDAMMLVHHECLGPQDRFVLSKGHAAGAYYVTLWSLGRLGEADLDTFHAEGTRLAGHPPPRGVPDVLFATGSLGHGLSLAAGLALSAKLKGVERQVVCMTSDGEWQEGSTFEALVFAAHHRLSNLTILVDDNRLQGFGGTREVASMDALGVRLCGFDVDMRYADGHDLDDMRRVLAPAGTRPTVVLLRTVKGHGVPSIEGRLDSHYLPLTDEQFRDAAAGLVEPVR